MKKAWIKRILAFVINNLVNPLVFSFSRFLNLKSTFARKVDGKIQIPIVEFCHSSGLRIKFIALIHFALKDFYELVANEILVEEEKGASVVYECLKVTEDEREELSSRVKSSSAGHFITTLRSKGLVSQFEIVIPKESWLNADIPFAECIQDSCYGKKNRIPACMREWCHVAIINLAVEYMVLVEQPLHFFGIRKEIILEKRNVVAVEGAMECLQNSKAVVMLWGVNHLSGIRKLLESKGFYVTSTTWYTAYEVMKLPEYE